MDFEHAFKCARFVVFIVLAFFTLAEVSAVDTLLEAFAVFLLTEGLLAIATFEVSLLFIANS